MTTLRIYTGNYISLKRKPNRIAELSVVVFDKRYFNLSYHDRFHCNKLLNSYNDKISLRMTLAPFVVFHNITTIIYYRYEHGMQ